MQVSGSGTLILIKTNGVHCTPQSRNIHHASKTSLAILAERDSTPLSTNVSHPESEQTDTYNKTNNFYSTLHINVASVPHHDDGKR